MIAFISDASEISLSFRLMDQDSFFNIHFQAIVRQSIFFHIKGFLKSCNLEFLVRLYRHIYDIVRPQADSRTKVFATLTLQQLLGYDVEACHGPLDYETCTGDPMPPTYAAPVPLKRSIFPNY